MADGGPVRLDFFNNLGLPLGFDLDLDLNIIIINLVFDPRHCFGTRLCA